MQVKEIDIKQSKKEQNFRPTSFDDFVGQEDIKSILVKAIISAKKRKDTIWHILFGWSSGYGKTTLANIVSNQLGVKIHTITGYAITKPSDLISIFNILQSGDILFIDEIHRIKPNIEEMLYIAMEDLSVDMVMPDGGSVRIPIKPFTLIWATTRLESLSEPLKNRFVYKFHFVDYDGDEKLKIIKRYLEMYVWKYEEAILSEIAKKVDTVPREIHNICIKIRDYMIAKNETDLTNYVWNDCKFWLNIDDGGITSIHKKYLKILENADNPIGVRSISLQLGMNEKSVEQDIEPLLMKLGKVEKTNRWRILVW